MELKVSNLTKTFLKKTAVDQVSYTFQPGVYALLGPNGSGKSTWMRMMCDILKPTKGDITFDGESIHTLDANYRDLLGYLPQSFGYYPQFRAYDFLLYFAILKGFDKKEAKQRVQEVLAMVNLEKEQKQKVKTFSGGMKQRLGIAQALLNDPKILIVDEPTAGLDPKERAKFKNIIARCAKDKIVIFSTHIVSDVESIATQILVMKEGKLYLNGTRENLIEPLYGKVVSIECEESELEEKSKQLIITGMTPFHGKMMVRGICEEMIPGATEEVPSLEDLYLSIFREESECYITN